MKDKMSYDPLRDLAPVALVGIVPDVSLSARTFLSKIPPNLSLI